jgi:5-methylthioribose kinase
MAFDVPPGYRALKEADVSSYLADVPAVAARLGGNPAEWKIREVGDGNLNFVFVVEGPSGGVVLKQALPYLRLVGESWALPLRRAFFEHQRWSHKRAQRRSMCRKYCISTKRSR